MMAYEIAGRLANDKIVQMAGEYMLGKMEAKKMCEYIDRKVGFYMDKRKNPAISSIRK